MYDFRLKSTDTMLRNFNGAFQNGQACPSSVNATVVSNLITNGAGQTFLRSAVEIMDDSPSNHDGLCGDSPGETCVYAPNSGAYQGEGDYYA